MLRCVKIENAKFRSLSCMVLGGGEMGYLIKMLGTRHKEPNEGSVEWGLLLMLKMSCVRGFWENVTGVCT